MTLTINLTSSSGVNFNSAYRSFFSGLTTEGWPYILGGSSQFEGKQIVLLDNIVAGRESSTKAIVLDGQNFNYYFNDHTLSGTLTTVRLSTLGNSYDAATGGFKQSSTGLISNVSTTIEIKGLKITNAYRETGDFHDTVTGLMGLGQTSGVSNPAKLTSFVWAEAHRVNGSAGADTYTGTAFGDTVLGNNGNDRLNGANGNDTITGGAGNDVLTGGNHNDALTGGLGADDLFGNAARDIFVFRNINESTVATAGRDTIYDFSIASADRVDLRSIDASTRAGGNQAFSFIGTAAFSKTAGELRYDKKASDTYVYGDVNGDGKADFAIHFDDPLTLKKDYFFL